MLKTHSRSWRTSNRQDVDSSKAWQTLKHAETEGGRRPPTHLFRSRTCSEAGKPWCRQQWAPLLILVSNHHSPLKGTRAAWRSGWLLGWGKANKRRVRAISYLKNGLDVKRYRPQIERAPTRQIWTTWITNIDSNQFNEDPEVHTDTNWQSNTCGRRGSSSLRECQIIRNSELRKPSVDAETLIVW